MRGVATENRRDQWEEYGPEGGPTVDRWWMICRMGAGGIEVIALRCCSGEALPLFSHEEETGLFLQSPGAKASDVGWWVRESRCGEVVSVLYGPCANVRSVILDPPAMAVDWTVTLVGVHRGDFLARLLFRKGAGQGAQRAWTNVGGAGREESLRARPSGRRQSA